jgi:hypothetical protein
VTERRVRFTATARRHVDREQAYWLEHRDYPDIFRTELESAIRILTFLPGVGSVYSRTPVVGLRRLYLEKVACHVYYTFDDSQVIVRAVWGARRERGPTLR